jgi:hypothetical protein
MHSFPDRDMFMRYLGGGVGHRTSCHDYNADGMDVDINDQAEDISKSGPEGDMNECNEGTAEEDMDHAASEDDDLENSDTSSDSDVSSEPDSEAGSNQDDGWESDIGSGPEDRDNEESEDDGFGAL